MILLAPVRALGGITTWASTVQNSWPGQIEILDTSPIGRKPSQRLSLWSAVMGVIGGSWVWIRALRLALAKSEAVWATVSPSIGFRVRDTPFLLIARALRVRTIVHVHGSRLVGLTGRTRLSKRWASVGLRAAAEVVVLDARTQAELWSVSGRRIRRLPNFTTTTAERASVRERATRLLYVGRISAAKGSEVLLEVAERLPPGVSLTIVGPQDPDLDPRFDRSCVSNGVRLTGAVSPAEVRREMLAADVLLLPSHHEGFPMVVLEAMALGLPVITSDVGACRDMVEGGDEDPAGVVLRNPRDVGAGSFAAEVMEKISQPDWGRQYRGGPQRVEARYSAATVVPQLFAVVAGEDL